MISIRNFSPMSFFRRLRSSNKKQKPVIQHPSGKTRLPETKDKLVKKNIFQRKFLYLFKSSNKNSEAKDFQESSKSQEVGESQKSKQILESPNSQKRIEVLKIELFLSRWNLYGKRFQKHLEYEIKNPHETLSKGKKEEFSLLLANFNLNEKSLSLDSEKYFFSTAPECVNDNFPHLKNALEHWQMRSVLDQRTLQSAIAKIDPEEATHAEEEQKALATSASEGAHSEEAHSEGAHSEEAHSEEAHPEEAHPEEAHPEEAHPEEAHPEGEKQPEVDSPETASPEMDAPETASPEMDAPDKQPDIL